MSPHVLYLNAEQIDVVDIAVTSEKVRTEILLREGIGEDDERRELEQRLTALQEVSKKVEWAYRPRRRRSPVNDEVAA